MAVKNTTSRKKLSTRRKVAYAAGPIGLMSLLSVGCIDGGLLPIFLQLFMVFLGANPSGQFQDNGQVEFAMVPMAQTGIAADKNATDDKGYEVVVEDPPGVEATVDKSEATPAADLGVFTILLDGSGSMERSDAECPGCPYDPDRRRVDAAQILSKEILARSPESRLGVFEFTAGSGDSPDGIGCTVQSESAGFKHTRILQNYTSDGPALSDGANLADSCGGTYLYDSLTEVLDAMEDDVKANFQAQTVSKGIIVVTDGEDTSSEFSDLNTVISKAKSMGIPVHVVGIGEASEFAGNFNTASNSDLVKILRTLASETDGFYAAVNSPDDLTELAENIAVGLTGTIEKTTVTLDPPPPSGTEVKGKIRVKNADGTLSDTATEWSFIAP